MLQNKVRVDLHSEDADIVMVQDYAAKQTTIIYPPNTTFPHGVCTVRRAMFTSDCSVYRPLILLEAGSCMRQGTSGIQGLAATGPYCTQGAQVIHDSCLAFSPRHR